MNFELFLTVYYKKSSKIDFDQITRRHFSQRFRIRAQKNVSFGRKIEKSNFKKSPEKNVGKMFNPLFYGQNFTEMKIPGSKVDKNLMFNGFLMIFDSIFDPIFI